MTDLLLEFEFVLAVPFMYDRKGEKVEAETIKISAPSTRNSRECAYLKQAFFRSLPDPSDEVESNPKDDKDDDTTIDGEALMAMLAMSQNVDFGECLEVAKKLFVSGIAMVDGHVKLTNHLVQQMNQEDFESMLGAFMGNFTVASALSKMNAAASKTSAT